MKIYLVGGAVRDQLLGIPVKEKDWVVVGGTSEEMLKAGFRSVGKDFPVFLHPLTHEEYALARIERKIGRGYTGFTFDTSATVTLEQDLLRRDLTINAMAQTEKGEIIDPFHGREDLKKKMLRHVSEAFKEDPVRILRVARFAARFTFSVAPETLKLMQTMVEEGEVNALVPERVWKELERALLEPYPEKFFVVLTDCHALPILFPENLLTSHSLKALILAAQQSLPTPVRFAVLLHSLSETAIRTLCNRYRVPNVYRELALLLQKYAPEYQNLLTKNAEGILNLLMNLDAFRRETRFKDFLSALQALGHHPEWLSICYLAAKAIDSKNATQFLQGKEVANKIKELRYYAIQQSLEKNQ